MKEMAVSNNFQHQSWTTVYMLYLKISPFTPHADDGICKVDVEPKCRLGYRVTNIPVFVIKKMRFTCQGWGRVGCANYNFRQRENFTKKKERIKRDHRSNANERKSSRDIHSFFFRLVSTCPVRWANIDRKIVKSDKMQYLLIDIHSADSPGINRRVKTFAVETIFP